MNVKLLPVLAVGLLSAAPAFSAPVTVDFEGVTDYSSIDTFYSGLGISFGLDAIGFANSEYFTYYDNAGHSPLGVMGPIVPVDGNGDPLPSNAAMNVASGFAGQLSFAYSANTATSIGIYSGLNGTGTLLQTIALIANADALTCPETGPAACQWNTLAVDFSGIAQSIQFGSAAGVAMFDDVTVSAVPLPAAAWLLLSGLSGLGLVRRKRSV